MEVVVRVPVHPDRDHQAQGRERGSRSAVASITGERNDCGRPDRVDARATYQGRTAARPGVTSDGGCGAQDGTSVVGFGDLPTTCSRSRARYSSRCGRIDTSVESDVCSTSDTSVDDVAAPARQTRPCFDRVATHEFGHVFGLDHVSETEPRQSDHERARIGACDDSAFTLGKGDMLGLERAICYRATDPVRLRPGPRSWRGKMGAAVSTVRP